VAYEEVNSAAKQDYDERDRSVADDQIFIVIDPGDGRADLLSKFIAFKLFTGLSIHCGTPGIFTLPWSSGAGTHSLTVAPRGDNCGAGVFACRRDPQTN
jgi:hypothetical protein